MASSPSRVLICVSGSIAVYKMADVVSELVKRGHEVQVLMTESAKQFVTPLVFETLSRRPTQSALFGADVSGTEHIRLARWADLIVIAPATMNTIAKLSLGIADDLVTTVPLASKAPLLIAPAMNTVMWEQSVLREHLAVLMSRGADIIEPQSQGLLACGEEGAGKMASVETLLGAIERRLLKPSQTHKQDLVGMRLLVTGGPTREPIDAVRYLTNHSSGKMGARLVEQALKRGAQVTYVLGIDRGVERPSVSATGETDRLNLIEVSSADEMLQAALKCIAKADCVIASAAVSDYRPVVPSDSKLKRGTEALSLALTPTVDVLATLKREAPAATRFVGFAAETDSPLENARKKLKSKKLDLVFVNPVAKNGERLNSGFGVDTNEGFLVHAGERDAEPVELMSKREVADRILDEVAAWRS
jgi:phosphopantothenoylcysteine decarboxylase/phosphopantothenate--cysteine ligase